MSTAVIALIVGLGGGVVGTLIKVSHDRGAELRGRMLDASDEFAVQVVAALHAARNTAGEIFDRDKTALLEAESARWVPPVKEAIEHVGAVVDGAQARSARVHLLFGHYSPAGIAATEIIARLRNLELAMRDQPHSLHDRLAWSQYGRNYDGVLRAHEAFSRYALERLSETWTRTFVRWLRRLDAAALRLLRIARRRFSRTRQA